MIDFKIGCWYDTEDGVYYPDNDCSYKHYVHAYQRSLQLCIDSCYCGIRVISGRFVATELVNEIRKVVDGTNPQSEPCWHLAIRWNDLTPDFKIQDFGPIDDGHIGKHSNITYGFGDNQSEAIIDCLDNLPEHLDKNAVAQSFDANCDRVTNKHDRYIVAVEY